MAQVNKGNSLTSKKLQPGWTIEDDGFGLLTCRATYIASQDTEYGAAGSGLIAKAPKRGDIFENDPRLVCHKSSSSMNSNGLQVITAEYCGIAKGSRTDPEVNGRGATTTDPIARHPAFVDKIGGTASAPLFGATFDGAGNFKEFSDPIYSKYGLKSYYSPSFSINGHFYTSDISVAKTLKDLQCTSSSTGNWGTGNLLAGLQALGPQWGKAGWWEAADESPQLLLTSVSLEYFGKLVKVSYEILVAVDGLDTDVYPRSGSGRYPRVK
jgi:hypothetical protein